MMFIIFCSYGLGMWYGATEVARDIRNNCFGDNCKTGGHVLTVFWAILNGAMVMVIYLLSPISGMPSYAS